MSETANIDFSKLTLLQALDLAVLIEEEARDRYTELAEQLAGHHTPDAAAFFLRMAGIEAIHYGKLVARRTARFGDPRSELTLDQIFDIEAPEYDAARAYMSVRQALEVALEAEVKAYRFYDRVLPAVTDPEAAALFDELRAEELVHQQLVQAQMARVATGAPDVDPRDYEDEPVSAD
jgi:rubrerythrin